MTPKRSLLIAATALALLSIAAVEARADLTGDSMRVDDFYPNLNTHFYTGQTFAGPADFQYNVANYNLEYTINVTASQIILSEFQYLSYPTRTTLGFSGPPGSPDGAGDAGVTFNGLVFTDFSHLFSGVTIDPATTLAGLDLSRVTESGNQLDVNMMGLYYTIGQSKVVLDVQTGAAVPDSTNTLTLLAGSLGLALIASLKNRARLSGSSS